MNALYSVAEIRAIEQAAAAALPAGTLMRRAGLAAGNAALELLAGHIDPRALVLAGPGNNGGDALEVAANLAQAGIEVTVLHLGGGGAPSGEAAHALARARNSTAQFVDVLPAHQDWSLVVDGLFGIGLARPLAGRARALAEATRAAGCAVLALDVPSGLDADTGAVVGPDGVAVRATHTITFIGDKPGLHTGAGRDHAGMVLVAPLDIVHATPPRAQLNRPESFARWLAPRAHNSHKGSYGDLAVMGGAHGMAGAPVLAARGALYGGAGRVYLAAVDPGPAFDSVQPEIMFRTAADFEFADSTLVVGPGMGQAPHAAALLARAQASACPLVLDADALNLLAASPVLQAGLARRSAPTVLTPHPLEAARLLGMTSAAVQADRLAAARALAARFNAVVVLKGSGTVIAQADGTLAVNPTGNPGLASAGTGDVLAGICGALLAQGWP
ncbi:MAG TPA: NAD(P)H-hydrate dehydratase, partial [Telluria sp.]|nr:NAD(P)H-hydrate dehydratase [Telluria sp.]